LSVKLKVYHYFCKDRIDMANYSNFADDVLLSLLQKGDKVAYTEIYNRYNGPLYIFAYQRIKDREESKDIIHEIFLKVWSEREQMRILGNLSVYLYTAVRNRVINAIAK